ncbi:hypothetical protein [Phenylobacterium sp.]|uniref:hypothetical protein n=1 Tax=Phenylobacterium sp. TaxID=1871053 RepID=UPI0025FA31D9|nr:hypothetical protein [Phenylobacterium sp.]
MTTIRSNPFPQQTPQRPMGQDASKVAAQRAFFEALGKAQAPIQAAPTAAAPSVAAAPAAAPAQRTVAEAGAEQPQRIPRPGSLIDIRV